MARPRKSEEDKTEPLNLRAEKELKDLLLKIGATRGVKSFIGVIRLLATEEGKRLEIK